MSLITRTVQQLVASVDVDDDGYVTVQVTEPLDVDEARLVAAAILKAADEGERYLLEKEPSQHPTRDRPICTVCETPVVSDPHSTNGWRHAGPFVFGGAHAARVDEGTI